MSLLIKGMKMPKNCLLCPFGNEFGECCVNAALEDSNEPTHSCPLIELQDHGDLIDRDAIKVGLWGEDEYKMLCDSPVVIPAERSEE